MSMNHSNIASGFEALESRELLSTSFDGRHGALRVDGTRRSDAITLSLHAGDATRLDVREKTRISDVTTTFVLASIRQLYVHSGNGADVIQVDESNGNITLGLSLFGDDGDDTIVGGHGNDNIDGLDGDDIIYGLEGNDRLLGGPGNDRIFAGAGNDTVFGESGFDTLFGGAELHGGDGNDVLIGGNCFGDRGDDTITASGTTDGGKGFDIVNGVAEDPAPGSHL